VERAGEADGCEAAARQGGGWGRQAPQGQLFFFSFFQLVL